MKEGGNGMELDEESVRGQSRIMRWREERTGKEDRQEETESYGFGEKWSHGYKGIKYKQEVGGKKEMKDKEWQQMKRWESGKTNERVRQSCRENLRRWGKERKNKREGKHCVGGRTRGNDVGPSQCHTHTHTQLTFKHISREGHAM